jgi:hypothetical protein
MNPFALLWDVLVLFVELVWTAHPLLALVLALVVGAAAWDPVLIVAAWVVELRDRLEPVPRIMERGRGARSGSRQDRWSRGRCSRVCRIGWPPPGGP